jgi:DNA-binding FrmR family transcriptional regulator
MDKNIKATTLKRLNRIEGQVRGVIRMIEEDRYCVDVLTQTQAIRAALVRVESQVLQEHVAHCVEGAIASGNAGEQRKKAAELVALLEKAVR